MISSLGFPKLRRDREVERAKVVLKLIALGRADGG
jgi:hypothetical protein